MFGHEGENGLKFILCLNDIAFFKEPLSSGKMVFNLFSYIGLFYPGLGLGQIPLSLFMAR